MESLHRTVNNFHLLIDAHAVFFFFFGAVHTRALQGKDPRMIDVVYIFGFRQESSERETQNLAGKTGKKKEVTAENQKSDLRTVHFAV